MLEYFRFNRFCKCFLIVVFPFFFFFSFFLFFYLLIVDTVKRFFQSISWEFNIIIWLANKLSAQNHKNNNNNQQKWHFDNNNAYWRQHNRIQIAIGNKCLFILIAFSIQIAIVTIDIITYANRGRTLDSSKCELMLISNTPIDHQTHSTDRWVIFCWFKWKNIRKKKKKQKMNRNLSESERWQYFIHFSIRIKCFMVASFHFWWLWIGRGKGKKKKKTTHTEYICIL